MRDALQQESAIASLMSHSLSSRFVARQNGSCSRALRPRLFGLIPRAKPAVFHSETGERVESIEWTTHPELLDAAEKAASHGVFAPPRIRGRPAPSGVCDVIIQFWST